MKRIFLLASGAALALTSSMAFAGDPEDLLPPAFRNPPPRATPTPTPTPDRPAQPSAPSTPSTGSTPVVQPIPDRRPAPSQRSSSNSSSLSLPSGFPSLEELERMDPDEVNELLGLRPKFDIPAAARRAVERVGVISSAEGGFPARSLAAQPGRLIQAALQASDGPVVSRWGHILLRRALASRLDAPQGMDPVGFAALRARALAAMGEGAVARALVQDIDGGNYNSALAGAATDAYLATGDVLGMCPVARLKSDLRDDAQWQMLRAVCAAYVGDTRTAERNLNRVLGTGQAEDIDVRLAQRFAFAAGESGRAVNIEWDGIDELTPWRFSLARAVGADIPESLLDGASADLDIADVLIPATPVLRRVQSADVAGARGVLSASAMVDLYSQLWASENYAQDDKAEAATLRDAYAAPTVAERVSAMRELWGADAERDHGRSVLTAYAAARVPPSEEFADDAGPLIASMLTAGLDANAMRWSGIVSDGSEGWALLELASTDADGEVSRGDVDTFLDADDSAGQRKSAFLLAGFAGLGRLDDGDFADFADRLGISYNRDSAWSRAILRAAEVGNPTLVALLAGVGMQGDSWDRMTPRQLYVLISALNRVGLSAEARMIAAEAVARG